MNTGQAFRETVTKTYTTPKTLLSLVSNLFTVLPKGSAHQTSQEVMMNSVTATTVKSNSAITNPAAQVFRDLLSTWQHNAASAHVDTLAAELTAQVAKDGSVCVGLMQVSSIPKLFGLIYFLDGYGLLLRQRYREQRDGIFVYVDRKNEVVSEFAGSVVQERTNPSEHDVATAWPEFAQAA
jgi:hypothetical protein